MTEALIHEIAQQIVQEQLLENWVFYLVLLVLLFIASSTSVFISSYFRKRGENYATKSDFENLLAQLRSTTEAAEQVKTAIAHADWSTREWKTIRRVKLEELIRSIYDIHQWLEKDQIQRFFGGVKNETRNPIFEIKLIGDLYFPGFEKEMQELQSTLLAYQAFAIGVQQKLYSANASCDVDSYKTVSEAMIAEFQPQYQRLLLAITAIEQKSPQVMKEVSST